MSAWLALGGIPRKSGEIRVRKGRPRERPLHTVESHIGALGGGQLVTETEDLIV